MANEIRARELDASSTYYYLLYRNSDNTIYDGTTFVTYNAANYASLYARQAAAPNAQNDYVKDFPALAAGDYDVKIRQQIGGSAVETDTPIGSQNIPWNGSAAIDNIVLANYVDTVESAVAVVAGYVDTVETVLATVQNYVDTVETSLTNLGTRLPAALVNGKMDATATIAGDVDGLAVEEALRIIIAALVGRLSGAESGNIACRDQDNTKNRIEMTADAYGNRLSVTLDAT